MCFNVFFNSLELLSTVRSNNKKGTIIEPLLLHLMLPSEAQNIFLILTQLLYCICITHNPSGLLLVVQLAANVA